MCRFFLCKTALSKSIIKGLLFLFTFERFYVTLFKSIKSVIIIITWNIFFTYNCMNLNIEFDSIYVTKIRLFFGRWSIYVTRSLWCTVLSLIHRRCSLVFYGLPFLIYYDVLCAEYSCVCVYCIPATYCCNSFQLYIITLLNKVFLAITPGSSHDLD